MRGSWHRSAVRQGGRRSTPLSLRQPQAGLHQRRRQMVNKAKKCIRCNAFKFRAAKSGERFCTCCGCTNPNGWCDHPKGKHQCRNAIMTRGQTQCFACKAAYKQHCAVKARVDVENDGGETSDAPLGQAMILSMQPAAFTSDHSPPTSYHSDPSLTLATGPAVGATAAAGSIEAALNAARTAARTAAAAIAPFDNGQQAMTLSATSALCRVPQHPHHAPSAETTAAAAAAATTITHAASAASTIVTNTDQCVPQVARVIHHGCG